MNSRCSLRSIGYFFSNTYKWKDQKQPSCLAKHINHVCTMWHIIKVVVNSMKKCTHVSTISVWELPDITLVKSLIYGL